MSFNPNSGQDWTPVTVQRTAKARNAGKSSAQITAQAKASGKATSEKKFAAGSNSAAGNDAGKNHAKLENDSETFAVKKVDASLSKAIQQARIAKSMTQKALATAINEKPQVIQQYESGQAIPNPQILNKLDRALGIHLPRNKKK
mmetsp:Transcript_11992/g.19527  ORF Transcript_11992/g.19527 Transcript_11992/m.19527 type:complete len:145 (-) Transcript_11992:81-515(-)